jgi:hypothetical protein
MRLPSALLLVDSDDSVARAARGLCLVSEWHGRDIFVPNPNRTHVCVPPPFSGAPGAGGPVEWGGGGCAGGGASRVSAGGGAKFSIFQFSCSMAQKIDTGSDNYGKTNRTSRSGGFAEFRPIPGRLWRGDRTPWCGVRPSVHWQMRGRPSQHRAGLPPGAAHRREATVVFACSPPPDSQPPPGLHGRNCAAASASLENERAARATVRSRAQRRRAKPAGRSSA